MWLAAAAAQRWWARTARHAACATPWHAAAWPCRASPTMPMGFATHLEPQKRLPLPTWCRTRPWQDQAWRIFGLQLLEPTIENGCLKRPQRPLHRVFPLLAAGRALLKLGMASSTASGHLPAARMAAPRKAHANALALLLTPALLAVVRLERAVSALARTALVLPKSALVASLYLASTASGDLLAWLTGQPTSKHLVGAQGLLGARRGGGGRG
jgi:hypothetical protein